METKYIKRHINRLLLDPNNYRFIDNPSYVPVGDERVAEQAIQSRTSGFLRGINNENIEDLLNSFKTNGVLRQDPIQVKRIQDDYYLVVEGNRRAATLKYLYDELKHHKDVGILSESDFKSIEVIEIVGEDHRQELIAMGLNHIGGKKKWSPLNQARLIQDLMEDYGMSPDEICKSLGISKGLLNKSLRALALIEAYRNSDFGDQFETPMYSIFEEIVKSADIRKWLDWDDKEKHARDSVNQERIFSWISKAEVYDEDNDIERVEMPIITKSSDIRELAKFIDDEKAVAKMETSRSVTNGLIDSEALGETRIQNALKNIRSELEAALKFSEFITVTDKQQFEKIQNKVKMLLINSESGMQLNLSSTIVPLKETRQSLFSDVQIIQYRRLRKLFLTNLRRLNLFVGPNNSGKTSVLESVYLMSRLNDLSSFLENERLRSKSENFNPVAVMNNLSAVLEMKGTFNTQPISYDLTKAKTEENIDRTAYVDSINVSVRYGDSTYVAHANIYDNVEPQIYYASASHLCSAAFTSPYLHNRNIVQKAHAFAVKRKLFSRIIDFIRKEVDSDIENIELVDQHGESRFLVSSARHKTSIDLTKYGEGLQRIFEIALLLAYCGDGVLCIDEIDSGIHHKLLKEFCRFILELATEFNVQVFISTHSKECVDAFAALDTEELMAYKMKFKQDKSLDFRYIDGRRLNELVGDMDIDIR